MRRIGQDAAQDALVAGDLKAAGGDLGGGELAREQGEDHLRPAGEDEIRLRGRADPGTHRAA